MVDKKLYRQIKIGYFLDRDSIYTQMFIDIKDIFENIQKFTSNYGSFSKQILYGKNLNSILFEYNYDKKCLYLSTILYNTFKHKYDLGEYYTKHLFASHISDIYNYDTIDAVVIFNNEYVTKAQLKQCGYI